MIPVLLTANPIAATAVRVWMLLCHGLPAGSYTDNCNRPFTTGDMLRDDHDNRRQVVSRPAPGRLTLDVSEPDAAVSAIADAG